MARKLFCELSPLCYRISVAKGVLGRNWQDAVRRVRFARVHGGDPLPYKVYAHNSLIRRRLGEVDMRLQDNKAINLALAAPRVNGVQIRPGETFSFWRLVGNTTARRGYKEGLTILSGKTSSGIGGGKCQFTNLLHWMVLHTPLAVVERHHHNGLDMFPDFGRQVPFGSGTAVAYNYIDYRVKNDTDITFQILVHTDGEYLRGEIRADRLPPYTYHIRTENECFVREGADVYRVGDILRSTVDRQSGRELLCEHLQHNHARVLYDTSHLTVIEKSC